MPAPTIGPNQLAQRLGPWRSTEGSGRARPLQAALAERITGLVVDGRLALGTRLPAERSLSEALGVSRTTVTAAYSLLRESGFAVSRQGSGSYVSLPDGAAARTSGAMSQRRTVESEWPVARVRPSGANAKQEAKE